MHLDSFSFTKSQGLGNDFILLDGRQQKLSESLFLPHTIKALCNRHRGIGADGVILLLPSKHALASVRIFNSDGNEAESCGNGWRCAAKFLWEHPTVQDSTLAPSRDTRTSKILMETQTGILPCLLGLDSSGRIVRWVEIAMGKPSFQRKDIPMQGSPLEIVDQEILASQGHIFVIHPVSMGNPHAVIFLDEAQQNCASWAKRYGPTLEEDSLFPSRINVEFARKSGLQNLELAVWERGCGFTQACGTGACAAVVVACRQGLFRLEEWVTVHLPGGELEVRVLANFENVVLRGPAVEVFQGTFNFSQY